MTSLIFELENGNLIHKSKHSIQSVLNYCVQCDLAEKPLSMGFKTVHIGPYGLNWQLLTILEGDTVQLWCVLRTYLEETDAELALNREMEKKVQKEIKNLKEKRLLQLSNVPRFNSKKIKN